MMLKPEFSPAKNWKQTLKIPSNDYFLERYKVKRSKTILTTFSLNKLIEYKAEQEA